MSEPSLPTAADLERFAAALERLKSRLKAKPPAELTVRGWVKYGEFKLPVISPEDAREITKAARRVLFRNVITSKE